MAMQITQIVDARDLRMARACGVSARYLNGPDVICVAIWRNLRNLRTIEKAFTKGPRITRMYANARGYSRSFADKNYWLWRAVSNYSLFIIFKEEEMKKRELFGLVAVVLVIAGCDAVKGLLGEDSGPDGGGSGGSSSGGVPVVFQNITVAGGGTTTLVTLVFDRDIPGLSEGDVTITSAGDTGAVAGVLSPTKASGAYTLAVSGVKETGPIAISVGKSGYAFNPATQTAVVNFDETANKVTFVGAIANMTANTQTTTALTLAFNPGISLVAGDITLWPGSTGAVMGNLAPSGDGAFSLAVPGIAAEGEVFVTVVKNGYAVRPAIVRVPVHYPGLATGGDTTSAVFAVVKSAPDWIAALAAISNAEGGSYGSPKVFELQIAGDFSAAGITGGSSITGAYKEVRLTGSNTVGLVGTGSLIRTEGNQTFVIDGPSLQGVGNNGYALANVGSGSAVELVSGAISGNNNTSTSVHGDYDHGSGGVLVDGGTFTIKGGTISGNKAEFGGGVSVYNNGTFMMEGGDITGNTASIGGGGVFVASGTFTMKGGTIGEKNQAVNGGGVSVDGAFTMNAGTIKDNTATSRGGGVFVASGTFTMNGGTIENNTAPQNMGGGVYVYKGTYTPGGTVNGDVVQVN
jgi:hypothetical protein